MLGGFDILGVARPYLKLRRVKIGPFDLLRTPYFPRRMKLMALRF
jgi:hypothetical protein